MSLLLVRHLWSLLTDFNNFSPFQSKLIWYKIHQLTLIVLPHYLTK